MEDDEILNPEDHVAIDAPIDPPESTPQEEPPTGEAPAEQATAESAPETSEDDKPDKEDDTTEKMVPHATFHQAHKERQELRRELQEERQARQRLDERTNILLERMTGKPEEQVVIPDPEESPIEMLAYLNKEVAALREEKASENAKRETKTRQEDEFQQISASVSADYNAAKAGDPDLDSALDHVLQSFYNEALVAGRTPQQAEQFAKESERYHIGNIYNSRASAGDYIKRLAESRGFATPRPVPVAEIPDQSDEERRDKHVSLSQVSGSESPSGLTAESLAKMSEDEFARLDQQAVSIAMGGRN